MAAATAPSPGSNTMAGVVRVVSYNILSPKLAYPEHFPLCWPNNLDPNVRLWRVLQGPLAEAIANGAIIALQEVSLAWSGALHAFFCQRGYHFVSSLYGDVYSDWMGVGLAWPTAAFECEAVEVVCLAETKGSAPNGTTPAVPPTPSSVPLLVAQKNGSPEGAGCFAGLLRLLLGGGAAPLAKEPWAGDLCPPLDPWTEALRRKNRLILARLKPHSNKGKAFCVATYHMPCLYGSTSKMQTMNIHTALAAQRALHFADGRPCVLAGDFNFQPGSSPYRLLTTGMLSESEAEYPPRRPGEGWEPSPLAQRFRSAYADALGAEPEFTNFAVVAGPDGNPEPPFIATLDYLFVTDHWRVESVMPLPARSQFNGPLPSDVAPSDHLPIGATLRPLVGHMKLTSVPKQTGVVRAR